MKKHKKHRHKSTQVCTQKFHINTKLKTKMVKQKLCMVKKMPVKICDRNPPKKYQWGCLYCLSTAGYGTYLGAVSTHSNSPLEKNNFYFLSSGQLEIASGSETELCVCFLSQFCYPVYPRPVWPPCMLQCEFICASVPLCLEGVTFMVSSIPSGPYILSAFSCTELLQV